MRDLENEGERETEGDREWETERMRDWDTERERVKEKWGSERLSEREWERFSKYL